MRKLALILNLALFIMGLSAFQAAAGPITGDIYFGAPSFSLTVMRLNDTRWDHATTLTYQSTKITGESGSFTSIPVPPMVIQFGTITFSPATPSTPQGYLWRIMPAIGVFDTVTAETMSAVISHQISSSGLEYLVLSLSGTGIAHLVGYDDTSVNWTLTGNQLIIIDPNPSSPTYGKNILSDLFTFNAHTWTAELVPEPSVLLFLGAGLLGVWGIRRKMNK